MDIATLGSLLVSHVLPVVGVLAMVLVISRFVFGAAARVVHGYSFTAESVERDNPAVLVRLAGMLFATLVAFVSIVKPTGLGWLYDLAVLGETSFMVLVALWLSMIVNDKLILHEFPNTAEVVGNRNTAVAVVEASTMIATALVFSGAFAGSEDKFATETIWFVVGQLVLVGLAFGYRIMIPGVAAELKNQNAAVALSMAGLLVAGGMALGNAVSGQFHSWSADLTSVGLYMLAWLAVMISLRLVVNFVIVPGTRLRRELTDDRNWGVGLVDGALSIAITAVFINLIG